MIVSFEARIGFRGSDYGQGCLGLGNWEFKIRDATMMEEILLLYRIFIIPFKMQKRKNYFFSMFGQVLIVKFFSGETLLLDFSWTK